MMLVTVILAVLGIVILTVGILGFTQRLPGNPIIGLRIPEARASEENWNLTHKLAGPAWIGSGVAMLAAALVASSAESWLWLIVGLLFFGAVFLLGMGAAVAAHTMAQIDAQRLKTENTAGNDTNCGCGTTNGCGSSKRSEKSAGTSTDVAASAAACASGQACGSCSLNGSCEGGGEHFASQPAIDLDTARRATTSRDAAAG